MATINDLLGILSNLEDHLKELDKNPRRNEATDYSLMSKRDLYRILKSDIDISDKKKVLWNQILSLRINIFSEYLSRIRFEEKQGNLDEAVSLMDTCLSFVSIPFIHERKQSLSFGRFLNWMFGREEIDSQRYVDEWRQRLSNWEKRKEEKLPIVNPKKSYLDLQKTFGMVHTVSFDSENVPPSMVIVFKER